MATEDKMQDVFPVNFDFVKGEQPSATKFTGLVKQTDTAFSKMTRAIGDPWDYNTHSGGVSSTEYMLSPAKLAQTSIARFAGPSDYASPRGASFQEGITSSITVTLSSYRNQWCVGFPLVYLSSDIDPSDSLSGKLQAMQWGTDIVDPTSNPVFTTQKTSIKDLEEAGDFHVDTISGVITSYSRLTTSVTLTISQMNMLGPGVPWGTSNVIPHWQQTSSLCYVTAVSSAGGSTLYNLAFPKVERSVRDTGTYNIFGDMGEYDSGIYAFWNVAAAGESAYYRMPYQLTSNLASGDSIPEGSIYIYDESQGRILPITDIRYYDEHNVRCECPTGWLTEGNTARILVTGSSLAENVHYLMSVMRETRHAGLSIGQKADTVHYTIPISHDDLVDRYAGGIGSGESYPEKYYFRESDIPTNTHPQYLHRAGYNADDLDGNHGNGMRGDIAFTGIYPDMNMGVGSSSGEATETYGITWGGGATTGATANSRLAFLGGEDLSGWEFADGAAQRFGFGLSSVRAASVAGGNHMGALTASPRYGAPFYLRGYNGTGEADGAVLAMDLGHWSEMNYMKLVPAIRTGATDVKNMPVRYAQTETAALAITPGLSTLNWKRLSATQVREFRFRAGSWNPFALNAEDSVGGQETSLDTSHSFDVDLKDSNMLYVSEVGPSAFRVGDTVTLSGCASNNGTHTVTDLGILVVWPTTYTLVYTGTTFTTENPAPAGAEVTVDANEFNEYFVSPGMVGCDFLNLYSNAIFFSDTGDGQLTSFTTLGTDWMADGGDAPSGIYFVPEGSLNEPYLGFNAYDSNLSASSLPFTVGDRHGLWYVSQNSGPIVLSTQDDTAGRFSISQGSTSTAWGLVGISAGANTIGTDAPLSMFSYDGLNIQSLNNSDLDVSSSADLDLYASDSIFIRNFTFPYAISDSDIGMAVDGTFYGEARGAVNGGWRWHARTYNGTGEDESYMNLLRTGLRVQTDNAGGDSASMTLTPTAFSLNVDGSISLTASDGNVSLNPSSDGYVVLGTRVKTTSGDPSGSFSTGTIYINTADNVVKIYAELGWRTLASW